MLNKGGAIIKIERNITDFNESKDNDIKLNNNTYDYTSHKSENEKIKANFVIRNNGTINDLFKKIENVLILILQGFHKISNAVIYI